ncbi:MAG: threonine--tRNA ligase [Patescibacteria group bacterium]
MNSSNANLESIRHSLAHILASAVQKKFPGVKLGIGPAIQDGFYYDFKFKNNPGPEILAELESEMRAIIKQNLLFSGTKITPQKARNLFKGQPFKLELIKDFTKDKKQLTSYATGTIFMDLCRGGHVKNTGMINPDAFKLSHLAGAYWRGDEKKPQLLRIYGFAFETKEDLDKHLALLEEAKRRDHKKLGKDLDLFTFSDLVGAGLPLWTPKGTVVRDMLDSFVWELRKSRGYDRVDIPHITKKDLYETSGHWDKFKEELFHITTREGHLLVLKPMNCPHHTQIYARKQWSYRELPQRYASTTKVYRDEQTGELAGLARVRAITQDDAHVFCRKNQIGEEMGRVADIINEFYRVFGFSLSVRLSFHDPKEKSKYLGTPKLWKEAEAELRKLIAEKGYEATEAKGEAAFYGPKIDFIAKDSLGREWQVATIQLDMIQPERFNLTCIGEDGKPEGIFMIHAAIMGSLERFISVLIEHTAGAFPVWLAPTQVRILPIGEKFSEYAKSVEQKFMSADIRTEMSENDSLGKRIRESEMQKIPYTIIVGEKEQTAGTISVRRYGKGDEGIIQLEQFLERIQNEVKTKSA